MTDITRYPGQYTGRCKAVSAGDFVWAVATGPGATVADQTRAMLDVIDANLTEAGCDKSRIVEATVYLTDMNTKDEMDAVWCAWIGDNGPCRACVGTNLAPGDRVEVKVLAIRA